MTPPVEKNVIHPHRALLLAVEDSMGTETHSLLADVTDQLRQDQESGVTISTGLLSEDYQETEQLVLLFPAAPINSQEGWYAVSLAPLVPGKLSIRKPLLEHSEDQFNLLLEIKGSLPLNQYWSYTRHPHLRQVYLPLFDDPNELTEAEIFHRVPLNPPSATAVPPADNKWTAIQIPLPPPLIDQSIPIDQCEILLEKLNQQFSTENGEFLQWQKDLITHDALDHIASELEQSGLLSEDQHFNITLSLAREEITRGKRIRPTVEHPLTLFDPDGTPHAGQIGCSISNQ